MNIWIFNHYAKTPSYSGGTRHYDMAQELIKKGHDVTIFASSITHNNRKENIEYKLGEKYRVEKIDGINFVWINTLGYKGSISRIFNMITYYINAKYASKKQQASAPNIVIGSTVHLLAAILGKKVAKKYNAKFYFEERDFWPQTFIDFKLITEKNIIAKLMFKIEKNLYDAADKIIVLFDRADRYVIDKGVNREKIIYLPNGISKKKTISSDNISTILNEHSDKKKIIYTGSHGEANDLHKILDLAKVMKNKKSILFLFFGDGNKKADLMKYAELNQLDNVIFYDLVKKEHIPYLLANCDLSIISIKDSPLYNFGFSMNKLYDYLYSSLPLIMLTNSKLAGNFNTEGVFVSDKLLDQKENILNLLNDETYYKYHSNASKNFSKEFLWENQINKLTDTF